VSGPEETTDAERETGRERAGEEERSTEVEAERRAAERRRASVFGDVLPETTRDDRAEGEQEPSGDRSEEWLRRQVPPHHG
jgi:hypothetical protein